MGGFLVFTPNRPGGKETTVSEPTFIEHDLYGFDDYPTRESVETLLQTVLRRLLPIWLAERASPTSFAGTSGLPVASQPLMNESQAAVLWSNLHRRYYHEWRELTGKELQAAQITDRRQERVLADRVWDVVLDLRSIRTGDTPDRAICHDNLLVDYLLVHDRCLWRRRMLRRTKVRDYTDSKIILAGLLSLINTRRGQEMR